MSEAGGHWFEPVADHLGPAYLRYSFTKGTEQEVDFLVGALGLRPGHRVLDVGCGPGRHSHALARRGIECHGVDIAAAFVELAQAGAPDGATFERLDARELRFDGDFDAAISLCQGAFGLLGRSAGGSASGTVSPASAVRAAAGDDGAVLAGMARAVRPGGPVAVSGFSAYFQLRWLEDSDTFDPVTGVNHERTTVRDPEGREAEFDLWTTCFTPRELRLLAWAVGLEVEDVWGVAPGAYGEQPPSLDRPELLLVARRPAAG